MRRRLLGFLLLLTLPLTVWAQVERWTAKEFFALSGGLNNTSDVTVLADNEASDLQNVVFTTSGAITKRSGWIKVGAAGGNLTGLAFYKQADADRFLVGTVSGSTDYIKKMDYTATGPDGVWDDITGAVSLSITDSDAADFAVAENEIVIEDGITTTAPAKWTGTGNAAALGGSPPNASMVEFHKRHLFLAGRSDAVSRVDFSALDDMESWTTGTDFVLVETDDGQAITGLKSGLDCLYIWKTASIWRLCGTNKDDFTLEQMVRGIGTASNASITVINNQFVFLSQHGDFMVYDGGLKAEILSGKIETTMAGLEPTRLDNTIAVAFDGGGTGDEDYLACTTLDGGTTHTQVLLFDTFHRAWTKFAGLNCNALAVGELSANEQTLFFGDYTGYLNRYPQGTSDDGGDTAISAYYQSGFYSFGIPQQKTFRHAQVVVRQEATGHDLSFQPRVDFASTGTATTIDLAGSGSAYDSAIYDTSTYADLTTTIADIELQQTGNFFQWYVSNANATEPFLLRGVRIWHEPTGRVQGTE